MANGINPVVDEVLGLSKKDRVFRNDGQQGTNNLVKQRGVDVGAVTGGTNRRKKTAGAVGSGTSGTRAELIKTGKTPVGEGPLGFAFRAAGAGKKIEGGRARGKGATGDIPGTKIPSSRKEVVAGGAEADVVKGRKGINPVVSSVLGLDKKKSAIGGTSRERQELLPGEGRLTTRSIEDQKNFVGPTFKGGRTTKGGFTELQKQEGAGAKKAVSPFSQEGIGQIFGSAAELAKLFSSKEFQERKAKGIQSAAGVKGRRADAKAKTERIKALSGVLEDLSATGGDNEALIGKIQEQIQSLIAGDGGGPNPEIVGKLAEIFPDDQVKTILGIFGR